MLDPRERCTVTDCLQHVAFETERLLQRNHSAAVGRRSRRQSAANILEVAGSRNASRPASVVRSKTPASEVRFTPVPPPAPDKMELGSASPDHIHATTVRHRAVTPSLHESDTTQPSQVSTVRSSPDQARYITDHVEPTSEPSQESNGTVSRFVRKKPVSGCRPTDEEIAVDPPAWSVLPAVDDVTQKDSGTASAVAAAAKKTYCVNLSGAMVPPAHRNKKIPTAAQTALVNAVTNKGKAKVCQAALHT